MIFGKFDERMRVSERIEPRAEGAKPEVRKAQPILWNQRRIRNRVTQSTSRCQDGPELPKRGMYV